MDNKEYIPSLTLHPQDKNAPAAPSPSAAEAPKPEADIPVEKLDINRLSPEEQAAVREFARQIELRHQYGFKLRLRRPENVAEFSAPLWAT